MSAYVAQQRIASERSVVARRTRLLSLFVVFTLVAMFVTLLGASAVVPTRSAGAATAGIAQVYDVPTSINDNCSTDVTAALETWLTSLPAGTSSAPIVVEFQQNACYLVNEGIFLWNFQDYVIDGNGAILEQTSPPATGFNIPSNALPAADNYCGTSTSYGGSNTYSDVPIMLWIDGGCDVVVENLTFAGPGTNGGLNGPNDQDSGIQISGAQSVVIDDVVANGVAGDFVTVSGLWTPTETYIDAPATDVIVENSNFNGAGRQGITLDYVNRALVQGNSLSNIAGDAIDIEADSAGGISYNIDINKNTFVGQTYAYLISAATGTDMENFAFTNNQMIDGGQMRIMFDPVNLYNVTITGNVATAVDSSSDWSQPAIGFEDTYWSGWDNTGQEQDILVANNTIPSLGFNTAGDTTYQPGTAVVSAGSSVDNLQVQNNDLPYTTVEGLSGPGPSVLPLWQFATPPTLYGDNGACGNTQGSEAGPVWFGAACTSSLTPTVPSPPAVPPITSVSIPGSGAVESGTMTLDASASAPSGVANVDFQVNAETVATAAATEYGWISLWNTTTLADGIYNLQSVACSPTACSASPAVPFWVCNHPPCTSVVLPANDTAVSGTQTWDATAITTVSGVSISDVDFFVSGCGPNADEFNNALVGAATFTIYGWLVSVDTHYLENGICTVTSVATDSKGNTGTSVPVAIVVDN